MAEGEVRTVLLCGSDLWDDGVRVKAYVRAGTPQARAAARVTHHDI